MKLNIQDVVEATQGVLVQKGPAKALTGVSTDTRSLVQGNLFIPLVAERDGHDFIPSATQAGAGAILRTTSHVARSIPPNIHVVEVRDTLRALGDLAAWWRAKHHPHCKIVGITGSSGKTTGKEMLSAILSQVAPTWKTSGNFNNLIGLPHTLFGVREEHQFVVLEMGMNAFGEIERLTQIAAPDVGWITMISEAHLEGVGSLDGVAQAKAELYHNLPASATAVVNTEYPRLLQQAASIPQRKIYTTRLAQKPDALGSASSCVCLKEALPLGQEGYKICAHTPFFGEIRFSLPLLGDHQISNALGALAVADALRVPASAVQRGFASLKAEGRRMRLIRHPQGVHLIDDCYNANPASMRAALHTLVQLSEKQPSVAVLGDMFELGEHAQDLHAAIGAFAATLPLSKLLTLGVHSKAVSEAAQAHGMPQEYIVHCEDIEDCWTQIQALWHTQPWILVKGSRGMRMERIVEKIEQYG
ncbi:MAG: UDP-N-acetylmuramoyl-tripeptide--D-alanyl-D-alanine ligase [Myxococcota bacterium]